LKRRILTKIERKNGFEFWKFAPTRYSSFKIPDGGCVRVVKRGVGDAERRECVVVSRVEAAHGNVPPRVVFYSPLPEAPHG
jgi:hypothetical protein